MKPDQSKELERPETPEILWPALRQYQHNIPNGELFAGFDYDETIKIIQSLKDELKHERKMHGGYYDKSVKLESQIKELREGIEKMKAKYSKGGKSANNSAWPSHIAYELEQLLNSK